MPTFVFTKYSDMGMVEVQNSFKKEEDPSWDVILGDFLQFLQGNGYVFKDDKVYSKAGDVVKDYSDALKE